MKTILATKLTSLVKQAKQAGATNITYTNLNTLAKATSNNSVVLFLNTASLKEKIAIKKVLAIVNGTDPKKISEDKGCLFGMDRKESVIASEKMDKIYPEVDKVETTSEQKSMKDRSKDVDKNPNTSDHKVKKDTVEKLGKENPEYVKFIKKRNSHMSRLKVAIDEKGQDLETETEPKEFNKGKDKEVKHKFNCLVDSCENYDSKEECNCSKDKVDITYDKDKAVCTMYKNIDNDLDIDEEELEKLSSRITKGETPKNVLSSLLNIITGKRKTARQNKKFSELMPGENIQISDQAGQPVNMTVDSVSTMTGTGEPALVAKTDTGETTIIPTGTEVTQVETEMV